MGELFTAAGLDANWESQYSDTMDSHRLARSAVGGAVILPKPPSPFIRCYNRDVQRGCQQNDGGTDF